MSLLAKLIHAKDIPRPPIPSSLVVVVVGFPILGPALLSTQRRPRNLKGKLLCFGSVIGAPTQITVYAYGNDDDDNDERGPGCGWHRDLPQSSQWLRPDDYRCRISLSRRISVRVRVRQKSRTKSQLNDHHHGHGN